MPINYCSCACCCCGNEYSFIERENKSNKEEELRKKKNAISLYKNIFINAVTGIEYLNCRYDPVGINTNGVTKYVAQNIDSYDEIFEKLYEKYDKIERRQPSPEIELVSRLTAQVITYHLIGAIFGASVVTTNQSNPSITSTNPSITSTNASNSSTNPSITSMNPSNSSTNPSNSGSDQWCSDVRSAINEISQMLK